MSNKISLKFFIFLAVFVTAGCSTSSEVSGPKDPEAESDQDSVTTSVVIDDEPVVGNTDNPGPIEETNQLYRISMDSEMVELEWPKVDGASSYILYRLPTTNADYQAIGKGQTLGAEIVFEGNELAFTDKDVPVDTFLTYFVVAEVDEGLTTPRWTEALTTTDTTPPTPLTGLVAEITDEGIVLSWSPSTDNLEFASYNVSLIQPGEASDYLGGGSDQGQTSFLDANPLDGDNYYVVTASDFHRNVSQQAKITVVWPGQ